ncbi:uncharacterized protein LOC110597052 [Ictidomys tridecemlineatus]
MENPGRILKGKEDTSTERKHTLKVLRGRNESSLDPKVAGAITEPQEKVGAQCGTWTSETGTLWTCYWGREWLITWSRLMHVFHQLVLIPLMLKKQHYTAFFKLYNTLTENCCQ